MCENNPRGGSASPHLSALALRLGGVPVTPAASSLSHSVVLFGGAAAHASLLDGPPP